MPTTLHTFKYQHSTLLLACLLAAVLTGPGCGLIYKQNIQQGNALE